jgi:hypothetical protein
MHMAEQAPPTPNVDFQRIIESAHRLGIELDEEEALQWMTAIISMKSSMDITIDAKTGVFGNKIVMLDFKPDELEYFREIGRLVEFKDEPGLVEMSPASRRHSRKSNLLNCDHFKR